MTNISNDFLAQMYAEDGVADQVEKVAQAAVLGQFVEAQGHAIDDLSPEQVMKVAANLFGEDSALVKSAMEEKKDMPPFMKDKDEKKKMEEEKGKEAPAQDKEAQEKVAEADFLGRFMAHSFHDELQKLAGEGEQPTEEPDESEKIAALYKAAMDYGHMKDKKEGEDEKKKKAFDMLVEARAIKLAQERGLGS